ncbi:homoserine kinase-like [Cornus florida]|uniref:homoserine kinase-like n=1 Tax=Cornus florida TaxID=4283 RepID=UPI002897055C|nr:homoserine kinase-like [Cornus florida]
MAAACVAVNKLFGAPLPKSDLVPLIIDSETKILNYSYNIAAAILGRFIIVGGNQLVYKPLKYPPENHLYFVILCLEFEVYWTKISESLSEYSDYKILCEEVAISFCVSSILASDPVVFDKAISYDGSIKVSVFPGWKSIKKVAMEAGAYGCSITAMGLKVVVVIDYFAKSELIGKKMLKEYEKQGTKVMFIEVRRLIQSGTVVVNTDIPIF